MYLFCFQRVVGESEEECKGGDICSSKTFSEYYQEMIEKHFEIPIGIYRSLPTDPVSLCTTQFLKRPCMKLLFLNDFWTNAGHKVQLKLRPGLCILNLH